MPRLTKAIKDNINTGVFDVNGHPVATPHLVYVDDDIYLDIADVARFERATAAGIEAIFILLGESDLTRRQDPISRDKLLKNDGCTSELSTRPHNQHAPPHSRGTSRLPPRCYQHAPYHMGPAP